MDGSKPPLSLEERQAVSNYATALIRAARREPTEAAVAEVSEHIISHQGHFKSALHQADLAKRGAEQTPNFAGMHYSRLAARIRNGVEREKLVNKAPRKPGIAKSDGAEEGMSL